MKQLRRNGLLTLALIFLLAAGLIFLSPPSANALGGGVEVEGENGVTIEVEWSDTEWGAGTVIVTCPYCGSTYEDEFGPDDPTAWEPASESLISDNFMDCCGHCNDCKEDTHCCNCGKCFENGDANVCDSCNSVLCFLCHDVSYLCDICGECRVEDDSDSVSLSGHSVSLPDIEHVCGDCLDDIWECSVCGNTLGLGGGAYLTYEHTGDDWCPDCELCRDCVHDPENGHCAECGACCQETDVCDHCGLCEVCREEQTHCGECDECYGSDGVEWCESGGDHCVQCCEMNDWLCWQCGQCMDAVGGEICAECGMCEECCLENSESAGCTHGYCVESSDYFEHLCPNCGECPDDTECEYCGFCEDCQDDYHCDHDICPENEDEWEEHLCYSCGECFELEELCEWCHLCEGCQEHCSHDLCPEDPEYDDHFCRQCGNCYEEDEFCASCGLCVYCCENNTETMGCKHKICIESGEFRKHYCFADRQCLEFCHHNDCAHAHVSTAWSRNASSHWHMCSDCGAALNVAGHTAGTAVTVKEPNAMTRTMGEARIPCSVCGETLSTVSIPYVDIPKDGSPYILSQPKNYEGRVTDTMENDDIRYASFSVVAGGGGTLSYQWYEKSGGYAYKLTDGGNSYSSSRKDVSGAQTPNLTVVVEPDSCYIGYEYYCVVTNAKGKAESKHALMNSRHSFGWWRDNGDGTHSLCCYGNGCSATKGGSAEPHRMGDNVVVKKATVDETGLRQQKCLDCAYTVNCVLPKVNAKHTHNPSFMNKNSEYHWWECTCGYAFYKVSHNFNAWQTTLKPTETKEGRQERKCANCGEIQYQTVEKLGHTHDFKTLIDASVHAYEVPNGYITDEFHVRYCSTKGCYAVHKEQHSYHSWRIINSPYTQDGVYHPGRAGRSCTECGHGEVQTFSGKWPILTEVFGGVTIEAMGGALISGPAAANAGEKVTLTVQLWEGFTVYDTSAMHGWSLNELRPTEGMTLYGSWIAYQNKNITDFKADGNTFSCTFTMPAGPVGLGFFPSLCDHKGEATYSDVIQPSCTVAGANVLRCKRCNGIVKTVSRIDPLGHDLPDKPIAGTERVEYCSVTFEYRGGIIAVDNPTRYGYSGDFRCKRCYETVQGSRTPLVHGRDDKDHLYTPNPGQILSGWNYVYETREPEDATCVKSGYTGDFNCEFCGKIVEKGEVEKALGHDWEDWELIREGTTTVREQESRYCYRCGATQIRTGDYSGPDYRLTADKTKVHFSFTYGDKVEPVVVTFTSVGRSKISAINTASEQHIGGVVDVQKDGMKVLISPLVHGDGIIWNMAPDDQETVAVDSVIGESGVTNKFSAPGIIVTASIKKTAQKYTLTVQGGEAYIEGKAVSGSTLQAQGGDMIRLEALEAGLVRWEVVSDKSGFIADILCDNITWTDDPACITMSPNDVTIKAVYEKDIKNPDGLILTIPAKTKTIRQEAFMGTSFRWVKTGSGCQQIESRAFADCKNLVGIFLPKDVTFQKDTFAGSKQLVIFAPAGGTTQQLAQKFGIPYVNWP